MPRFLPWNVSVSKQLVQKARALRLQKGFSQNFLVDEAAIRRIVDAANDPDKTLPMVEIGPGAGFLTEPLLETGHPLTAIEVDPKMIRVLQEALGGNPNLHLIHQDVRQVDLRPLLGSQGIVIGNIPYHLTGPILFQIAGELADATYPLRQQVLKAILMFQKEVCERLLAKPGDKAYSQLTLQIQYWFEVSPVVTVPRGSFYPSPAVDSMVVQLVPREQPAVTVQDLTFFSKFLKNSFMHRRKTLLNNLKLGGYGSDEELKALFATMGLTLTQRPQELSMSQYGALSDALVTAR